MDIRRYIGIPFKDHGCGFDGCDCYGLVRLAYLHELDIRLPFLGDMYLSAFERPGVGYTVRKVMADGWAVDVSDRLPLPLDVMVFRRGGIECHVGLWVDAFSMLHVIDGSDCCLERFDTYRWARMYSRRLRHASLC